MARKTAAKKKTRGKLQSDIDAALARARIHHAKKRDVSAEGWPHDAWADFLSARAKAIDSMLAAGYSFQDIVATLNLTVGQARDISERGSVSKSVESR